MDHQNTHEDYEERPRFRRQRSWRTPFLVALTIGVTLVMVFTMGMVKDYMDFQSQEARLRVFDPFVSSYLEAAADESYGEGAGQAEPVEDAHLLGRLVVVHAAAEVVYAWAHEHIGEEICAMFPDEVGTVAILRPEWKRAGDYVDAKTGKKTKGTYRGYVHVTLLDWTGQKIIARRSFEARRPRARIPRDSRSSEGLPMWDAVRWLKELPRR